MLRTIRWLVLAVLCIGAAAVAFFAAVVYLPQFNGVRQDAAGRILSSSFDRDIEVNGPVTFLLGDPVGVSMNDVAIDPSSTGPDGGLDHVDHGEFAVSLASLLAGTPVISRLDLSGASIEIKLDDRDAQGKSAGRAAIAQFPASFLNRPLSGDMALKDVSLRFLSTDTGLNEVFDIASLHSRFVESGEAIAIEASGRLNEVEFGFKAKVDNPQRKAGAGAAEIEFTLPGNKGSYSGTVDLHQTVAVFDGRLQTQIGSLGDILDAIGLKRVIEGTGSLTARLSGALDSVAVSELDASAESSDGNRISATGNIANLAGGLGLDIAFSGVLGPDEENLAIDAALADYRVTGFEGFLGGEFAAMQVDRFSIETNAFSVELRSIGPISVQRIAKDQEGKLGIQGIHILNGPQEMRTLDLRGNIADALDVSGIDLAGTFDIETANALSLEGGPGLSELGRLAGEISISDADGTLGIESFTGQVTGSELIDLAVSLVVDEFEDLDEVAFKVDLKIADFARFSAALGEKTSVKGGLNFSGELKIANEVPSIDGRLTVNRSSITGTLSAQRSENVLKVAGNVGSDSMAIADFRSLWEVNLIGSKQDIDYIVIKEHAFDGVEVDVGIDARKIAEAGKSIGNIKGRLLYAQNVLRLDPIAVTYLGGTIHAKTRMNLAVSPASLSTSGRIAKLQVGKLLSELGAQQIASGSLNAEFDLSGTAARNAFAGSASGTLTASLWGGSIGTNLIDLTGLDYVSWAFTRQRDSSTKLTCAIFPLHLKRGTASASRIVVETENVMIVGKGTINLARDRVHLDFEPIPKNRNTLSVATPFTVSGSLRRPEVEIDKQAKGRRIATEFVGLPFNFLANLMRGGRPAQNNWEGKPCVVPKANGKTGPR
jgi:AsmA family protein